MIAPNVLWAQASAMVVRDPTQPAYVDAVGTVTTSPAPVSRLTSIVRPQNSKPYAVIDGVVTYVGGTLGDERLIQIKEYSVVLKSGAGTETLMLTPGIEKTPKQNPPKRSSKALSATKDPS